jgi:serine/threonine-protein kinase
MTPTDRRKRITDVFQLAVQMPSAERRRFVERECRGDDALMREVESLLSDYQSSYEKPGEVSSARSETSPAPSVAGKFIGKYKVQEEIGSGGFGRVYSAHDPGFNRTVAIKVMSAPGDPDLVQRFRTEATTVANLHHKNIVTVHDSGVQDGAPYLVMEYLKGTNLQDLIRENSLTLLQKIEIMSEVANGLQCAHELGITHRDVKPANIMRLASGAVKIMDFGIARIASETASNLTKTGFIIGTLAYMSPEQFNGSPADAQCDIFAFGVTFYELLTGRNPFASPNTGETITRIMTLEPPPLSSFVPGCPEGLDRILKTTLAKSRESRYSSLSDVALDAKPIVMELQRAQAGPLYTQANQLFDAGQLDAAQAAVRKVLEFDPVHAPARQLRTQIEQALQRRDAAGRAGTHLDKAEKQLRDRQLQDAAATLSMIRQLGPLDPQLKTRLERAESQIEQAKRAEMLLASAREELAGSNLTDALRLVTEALGSDPANQIGKELLQQIRAGMAERDAKRKLQEAVARAEGLLLIGETEQALNLIAGIEKRYPNSSEALALRSRAEDQQAEEIRGRRITDGAAECKTLLRSGSVEQALARVDGLLADFPNHTELVALHRHVTERLVAERRAKQTAQLKADALASIERREYDRAIRALEAGVAKLGDDGELTRLLQSAVAGKAAEERNRAVALVAEEASQLRRQGKVEEAQRGVEQAIQVWGDGAPLAGLLQEILAERKERDKRRAIQDAVRKAGILLEQKKPEAAADLLRQSIARSGEDAEIAKLLKSAESQLQSRDRSVYVSAAIEEIRKLAASKRWQEALDRIDEGLRTFPNEPALAAERESVRASLEKDRRERAIAETLAKVQPMLAGGRGDEAATVLMEAKLGDLGKDSRLLEVQRKLAELAARKEQAANIEKACQEAFELRGQNRFDEAARLLDACNARYSGSSVVAAALSEVGRDREDFNRKKAIDAAMAVASELVQQGEFESARRALEDSVQSYPDSRELAESAAHVRSLLDDAEHKDEIAQLAAAIEQALAQGAWNDARSQAKSAIERFPREAAFASLKRRADEGKYKAEIDNIVAAASDARSAGNLAHAAEIVAAGRKRWEKEKRLKKLGDEIEDARADEGVTAAKTLADAGRYGEAGQRVGEVLAQRPGYSPALDLAQSIAVRQQDERIRTGARKPPDVKPHPQTKRTVVIVAGAIAALLGGLMAFLLLTPKA